MDFFFSFLIIVTNRGHVDLGRSKTLIFSFLFLIIVTNIGHVDLGRPKTWMFCVVVCVLSK